MVVALWCGLERLILVAALRCAPERLTLVARQWCVVRDHSGGTAHKPDRE